MKRVTFALLITIPLLSHAQKRNEYTFDFTKPETLNPPVLIDQVEDFNGKEVSFQNIVLKSDDGLVSVSFKGREEGSMGGALQTGWPKEDGTFDHYLFIIRGGGMVVSTANGITLDSLIFSTDSYVGNLKLLSPEGVGRVEARNESWYGLGAKGITELVYQNYGQNPKIGAFTVIYRSPMDILEPIKMTPANNANIHSIREFVLTFPKPVKIGTEAEFKLIGPKGFNSINNKDGDNKLVAKANGNTVIISIPESISIDESIESKRGTYTLTIGKESIITDDSDGFYNPELKYTFNVVEAFDKYEFDMVWPDPAINVEKIDTIVLRFPTEIGKFSADELKLVDRSGNIVRSLQAKWLEENEYTAERPFYKNDIDIYNYVQLVFSGEKHAPVKASGIYYLTIPEGFIWNNKYDPTAEDGGVAIGARFNPEINIEYNVNGVEYPTEEVLHRADSLLSMTGAGYPAADSKARVALQALVDEGIGGNAVFEEAMAAFYAETNITMPADGYYLLSAVPSEGDELYVSYDHSKIGLTSDVEEAAHLLATVNEDGTLVFMTPDNKYLTQLMPAGANVSEAPGKMNNLTFARLSLKDDEGNDLYTPEQLFGLWSINGIVATNDEGEDITAYTLVNLQSKTFGTDRDKSLRYFSEAQTNAFRLTETDAPIPDVSYFLSPDDGSEMESLYYITLTFGNDANDVKLIDMSGIVLKGTSTRQYTPTSIANDGRQFIFYFDDVAAGTYTLSIPKGAFTYTYNDTKTVEIKAISATYRVNNSAAFLEDFLYKHSTYFYEYPNIDTFVRDVDLNNFSLVIYDKETYGLDVNKAVRITDPSGSEEFARGHLVFDDEFVDEYGTPITHMVLVLDEAIQYGTLPPQTYCYNIPAGTFGDSNFAEWLKDPQNKRKGDCHVNAHLTPMISVDNDRANIIFNPQQITSHISKLSDITITFPYFENVDINGQNNIEVLERYTGRTINTSVIRVEGTNNKFTFASDEILTADTSNGGYMILIPLNFFKAGDYTFPSARDMELFYYAQGGGGDAIDTITTDQQSETIYDLAGRRVKDTRKAGIYIVGGRKVVVQ